MVTMTGVCGSREEKRAKMQYSLSEQIRDTAKCLSELVDNNGTYLFPDQETIISTMSIQEIYDHYSETREANRGLSRGGSDCI